MTVAQRVGGFLPASARTLYRNLRSGALISPDVRTSYSQEGEDLLLARMFSDRTAGFYVDVGAHHPTRFSNTHLLYRNGWRGINIDATPGSMRAFRLARPGDVNLEVAVSTRTGQLSLYLFDEPALNSLSQALSMERHATSPYSIKRAVHVDALPLSEILSAHLPAQVSTIDLLTVDVEGQDLDVLQSNDWSRFRPQVVMIEVLATSLDQLPNSEEARFLGTHGYELYSKLVHTAVFVDRTRDRTF